MARYRQGPIDWFVIALSPALVIGLITTFLFFVTGFLYGEDGKDTPWNYYLFWYIFGMVLTARISLTQEIANRASLYSLVLSIAVWFFLSGLVQVPGLMQIEASQEKVTRAAGMVVAGVLVALGWFLSWKITIDVTDIEENSRIKSGGHLDPNSEGPPPEAPYERQDDSAQKMRRLTRKTQTVSPPVVLAKGEKPSRAPGSTVILFVLLCLPLFALGQFLLPGGDSGRRLYGLFLAGCFFGCALGLLMTTHFLALRLYLGRRGITMPIGMALTWLTLGGCFIVGVVIAAMVLPNPDSMALYQKAFPSKEGYQAGTKNAMKQGAQGKGDEKVANKQEVDQKEGKKTVEGKKGGGKDKGDNQGGDKKGKDKADDNKNQADKKDKDNNPGNKDKNEAKEDKGQGGDKKKGEPKGDGKAKNQNPPNEASNPQQPVGPWVKILAIVIGIPLAIFLMYSFFKAMRLQQGGWLDWLNGLFGWLKPKPRPKSENNTLEGNSPSGARSNRFIALENPFETGEAIHMKDTDLVAVTAEAVIAFAGDQGPSPMEGETFHEIVKRLTKGQSMSADLLELVPYHQAQQYYHLPGKSDSCRNICAKVWKALKQGHQPA